MSACENCFCWIVFKASATREEFAIAISLEGAIADKRLQDQFGYIQ